MLVGPAIGGVLVASFGPGWCFLVDIVGLFVASMLYAAMRRYPHVGETEPPSLSGIGKGLRYALSRRDLLGTYVVDIDRDAARDADRAVPGAGADRCSATRSCSGCSTPRRPSGALVATALSGWTSRVHRHGRAIVLAAMAYGACIALGGHCAHRSGSALLFFALAGAADMISAVFRGTIWNQTIPDNMRGRLAGIEMLSYSDRPARAARSGPASSRTAGRSAASIVSGGVSCVAGVGLTAMWLHDFWRYDARHRRACRGPETGQAARR